MAAFYQRAVDHEMAGYTGHKEEKITEKSPLADFPTTKKSCHIPFLRGYGNFYAKSRG